LFEPVGFRDRRVGGPRRGRERPRDRDGDDQAKHRSLPRSLAAMVRETPERVKKTLHWRPMDILAFDIETVPDTDGFRRVEWLAGMNDVDIARSMLPRRRQESGSDFLRLHLQRIVAVSCVLRRGDDLQVWSLGDVSADEAEIVSRFFAGI